MMPLAARRLGDASMCIVLWVTKDSRQLGMASYGKTMALCKDAGQLGDAAYQTIWERLEAKQ